MISLARYLFTAPQGDHQVLVFRQCVVQRGALYKKRDLDRRVEISAPLRAVCQAQRWGRTRMVLLTPFIRPVHRGRDMQMTAKGLRQVTLTDKAHLEGNIGDRKRALLKK